MRKLNVAKTVIVHGVTLCVRDAYIKGTIKSLTMWDSTDEVRWRMFQLGSLVVQQIGVDNLPVINRFF